MAQLGRRVSTKGAGTSGSHRMTQEALGNAAVKRGVSLAESWEADKLRKHKGMAGLTESEFNATVNALKRFDEQGIMQCQRQTAHGLKTLLVRR